MKNDPPTDKHQRLQAQRKGEENWNLWEPYLAERTWGTVRGTIVGWQSMGTFSA